MGTRHLIAIKIDGEYKLAKYGQWDGYPSGQGVSILGFLHLVDHDVFKAKCRALRFADDGELAVFESVPNWPEVYPWLSRDAGSTILTYILEQPDGLKTPNMINFAADSLFCEFAYVIDYDANTFEMFKGFNKEPVPEGQRFADLPREVNPRTHEVSEYYPVVLANTWALDNLPTEEEFLLQTTEED